MSVNFCPLLPAGWRDALPKTLATIPPDAVEIDAAKLIHTLEFALTQQVLTDKKVTLKRTKEHPFTVIFKKGKGIVHLSQGKVWRNGNNRTIKFALCYGPHHLDVSAKKTIKFQSFGDGEWESAQAESRMFKHFENQPNSCLIQLFVEILGYEKRVFYTEFATRGDLIDWLKTRPPFEARHQVAKDLCTGLVAIEKSGHFHSDLTFQNVFITAKNGECRARVGDFGHACCLETKTLLPMHPFLMPPELWKQDASFRTDKIDPFALAFLLYVVLLDRSPLNFIEDGKFDPDLFELYRFQLSEGNNRVEWIIADLLDPDPNRRDSLTAAKERVDKLKPDDLINLFSSFVHPKHFS